MNDQDIIDKTISILKTLHLYSKDIGLSDEEAKRIVATLNHLVTIYQIEANRQHLYAFFHALMRMIEEIPALRAEFLPEEWETDKDSVKRKFPPPKPGKKEESTDDKLKRIIMIPKLVEACTNQLQENHELPARFFSLSDRWWRKWWQKIRWKDNGEINDTN